MKTREHMELVVLTHNSPSFSPSCCISRFFNSISSLTCTPSFSYLLPLLLFSILCKMEPNKAQGKRSLNLDIEEEEEEEEADEDEDHTSRPSVLVHGEDDRRKRVMVMNSASATSPSKKGSAAGGSMTTRPSCQAQSCNADLSDEKQYYRRHKICDFHSKAPVVVIGGLRQRFCQQCSRFHDLSEFDENKRSCRRRLAGHNERRRKNSSDYPN